MVKRATSLQAAEHHGDMEIRQLRAFVTLVVIENLPSDVSLDSFTQTDGAGDPLYKIDQSVLFTGTSLPAIPLIFDNPSQVPIQYAVKVFDGIVPERASSSGLVFEPNLGQANSSVSFIARGADYAIGRGTEHAAIVLAGDSATAGAAAIMEWVGGNSSPSATPLGRKAGVSHYFIGDSSVNYVPHYDRVRYASVYDGIDLEFYGREGVFMRNLSN